MSEPQWPEIIADTVQLEELLSRPTAAAIRALGSVEGNVMVLGVAGKMGLTLARMARRASDLAGARRKVIGVSRFSRAEDRAALESHGVETIQGDLLNRDFLDGLPDAPNVVFMAGMKFGATGNEPLTWAMNAYLPGLVCQRFAGARIVAFSTGNVYGLVPVHERGKGDSPHLCEAPFEPFRQMGTVPFSTGSRETDLPRPEGEYAMSCLGRERIFEYFSRPREPGARAGLRVALARLNYAVEMRYGVLVDLARKVYHDEAVDLSMGYVNVIWQGDASAMAMAMLADAASPALVLNVAGPERLSVRAVCQRFGDLLGKRVRFTGTEAADALLSNAEEACRRYGPPCVGVEQMLRWIAAWVARGGASLNKPTHFEVRDGKF